MNEQTNGAEQQIKPENRYQEQAKLHMSQQTNQPTQAVEQEVINKVTE